MRETSRRVSLWREHEFGGTMMATGGDCGEGKGRNRLGGVGAKVDNASRQGPGFVPILSPFALGAELRFTPKIG